MSIPMKDLPIQLRPFEKCKKAGAKSLDDAELLAMILRTGIPGQNVIDTAELLLKKANGNPGDLSSLSREEISSIPGIGITKALQLEAVFTLTDRIMKAKHSKKPDFRSPSYIASYYMEEMRHQKRETLKVLYLDSKCRLLKESDITVGTVNRTVVPVREIFIEALTSHAVSIILLHNHPSGDPTPSKADLDSTKEVMAAGNLIQIPLTDHIIIGDCDYISMREQGIFSWN